MPNYVTVPTYIYIMRVQRLFWLGKVPIYTFISKANVLNFNSAKKICTDLTKKNMSKYFIFKYVS